MAAAEYPVPVKSKERSGKVAAVLLGVVVLGGGFGAGFGAGYVVGRASVDNDKSSPGQMCSGSRSPEAKTVLITNKIRKIILIIKMINLRI